jgi:hypothetical protein
MSNSRTKGRVVFPSSLEEKLKLGEKILEKHRADGDASPLNSLSDIKWSDVGPTIAPTLAIHRNAVELSTAAEKLYRQRDQAMIPIEGLIRSSAAVLKGIYSKNPKQMGDWGLQIDDSPQQKKEPKK